MDPSCSDCGHRASFHQTGGCNVLVFDRIDGARKDCNCRRIFYDRRADEASLGVSREDLRFGMVPLDQSETAVAVAQPLLTLHRCSCRVIASKYCLNHGWDGPGNLHVREQRLRQEALRLLPGVVTSDGPCSILPANHPALNT